MTAQTYPWLLRDDDRGAVEREVERDLEYHRAYAGTTRRGIRGLVAVVALLVGFVSFAVLAQRLATVLDASLFGREGPSTPLQQAAGAIGLAALIPYSMFLNRVVYGAGVGSLHSVTGRFRFGVLGRALLVFGPPIVLAVAVLSSRGSDPVAWTSVDLIAYVVVGTLLTPLAAAGEEYGFRGLLFRVLGSWAPGPRSGAVVGIVVTTVLFSLIHGTVDPFLFTSYLVLFGSAAIVTWRTGGLEVAVVVHAVYNVTAIVLATALHADVGGELAERGSAVGSWVNLVPSAVLVVVTAVVWSMTRRGPVVAEGVAS